MHARGNRRTPGNVTTSPWLHPEALAAIREALRLRLRLMPYLYGGLLAAFAIRVVLRRFPPFSPANQRLTDSRMAALAAKASNSRKAD